MRNRNSAFDWSQAQAFLATAETGSFSGAAELLGMSQPTVGRHVAALDSDLGLLLFDRVGKSLMINDKGLALLAHVKVMKEAADLVSLSALGKEQMSAAPVSVTAVGEIGQQHCRAVGVVSLAGGEGMELGGQATSATAHTVNLAVFTLAVC